MITSFELLYLLLEYTEYLTFLCLFFTKVFEMQEIVECLCKGVKPRESYPPSVRAFCMSVHYLSPRGYDYLRSKFGNHIPHSQTIRQWYRNSSLDASSGIGKHALGALQAKNEEMISKQGKQLCISLVFDEMAIQRNLTYCRATNKFIGLIDKGVVFFIFMVQCFLVFTIWCFVLISDLIKFLY